MSAGARFKALRTGDPAPWFEQRSPSNPHFHLDTMAGRYIVLCFFHSAADERAQAALNAAHAAPEIFNDAHASFFGISTDPADEHSLANRAPGIRMFWDFDRRVSLLYGGADADDGAVRRMIWVVLDPMLRVLRVIPFGTETPQAVITWIAMLPPPHLHAGLEIPPPVLILPNVFEPELCSQLIGYYEAQGGARSGFMREESGKTVLAFDDDHKRRRDCLITDDALKSMLQERVRRRIAPEVAKAHQFHATRMERYLIGCYSAEESGHFRPHRDNTTKGTAHRRFAVSITLNSDFDGGTLSFPEYGPRAYKPLPGGAVVFSCSLLHAVAPVTRGTRLAFLPFLYDEAAATLRERNNAYLGEGVDEYNKTGPQEDQ